MKLSVQRSILLGSALASLAVTGFGFQKLNVPHAQRVVAAQDGADDSEAIALGHGYERRGDFIFLDGQRIDQAGRADLNRFEQYLGRRVVPANGIDAASFVVLSGQYAKDQFAVYYKWTSDGGWFCMGEVPGADPETFEAIDLDLAKDARYVWRTDQIFPGADPKSAEIVNPGYVWKDRKTVYYQHLPMENADPLTFRHLDQAYYRDAKNVYWSNERLIGVDPDTFRTFGDVPYAVDKNRVWMADEVRESLDAASFRLFHNHVYADKDGVYVSPKSYEVRGVDAATFEKVGPVGTLGAVLLRDKNSLYVFESAYYLEMYRISRDGDGVVVTKDVWRTRPDGKNVLAGYTTATWNGKGFSKLVATITPRYKRDVPAQLEVEKVEWMADTLKEAIEKTGYDKQR